jgi:hypothetical protein
LHVSPPANLNIDSVFWKMRNFGCCAIRSTEPSRISEEKEHVTTHASHSRWSWYKCTRNWDEVRLDLHEVRILDKPEKVIRFRLREHLSNSVDQHDRGYENWKHGRIRTLGLDTDSRQLCGRSPT